MKKALLLLVLSCLCINLFSQAEGLIPIEGGQIHYRTFGSGTPVLIINGGPGMNSQGFESLARIIAENNLSILYDQRGTGESYLDQINAGSITIDLMVDDIEILRKHLEIENWIVLGHSFGGMLGAYYTAQYPQRVNALILSSSGGVDLSLFSVLDIRGRLTAGQRDSLDYWNAQIAGGDTSYLARLGRGRNLAPAYLYEETLEPIVAHRLTQGNRQINGLVFSSMRAIGFDCKPALANFQKPVLIIQGREDIIPVSLAEETHELLPNSTLVIIDKCVHYGWLEQPGIYIPKVNDFIAANRFAHTEDH